MDVVRERVLDGLLAVGRLGDNLEIGLSIEDHAQSAQDDGMVIGDQNVGFQWGRHRLPGSRGMES